MIYKDLEISCNGKVLATKVYVPESVKESSKGAYGIDLNNGTAMMFMNDTEGLQVYDMFWMRHDIGYISLNKEKKINKVGVMKGAFLGIVGGVYPMKNCMFFIELAPEKVKDLKVGDTVEWKQIQVVHNKY